MQSIKAWFFVLLQFIVPKLLITKIIYRITRIEQNSFKNLLINKFINLFQINTQEVKKSIPADFASLNEFFIRELNSDARIISTSPKSIVSPADGKISALGNITKNQILQAKNYYYKITAEFGNIGYNVSSMLLDSSHYGVPQTRKRVIFIAVRKDVTDAIGLTSLNIAGVFPEKNSEVVTCGKAFEDLNYDEEEIKMLTETFSKGSHFETASKMPLDPKKVLTGCDYHPKGHHFNMKRISRFKPAPTITASGGCIHWSELRKLALGETRRLTSLPEDFKLTGKWEQRSERMGRMVPPLMMKAIAGSIYKKVLKPYKELNNG